jgi:AcrR family transcriptional regulator
MKKPRKDALKTCNDLIEAACRIFAEKGFKDATVAEICKHANTNVASVNYHFRDKETLYAEAWRYSFRKSLKKYPPEGGVSDDAPPEERLRGRILSLISKILGQNHKAFSIMQKELAHPTGLLKELVKEEIKPLQEKMTSLVRELLGPQASVRQVQFCRNSIMGQCFHLLMMKQGACKVHDLVYPISSDDIDSITEHIVKFSLAGIKAIREDNSSKKKKGKG